MGTTTGGASTVCGTVGTTTGNGATGDGICAAVGCSTGASVTATVGTGAVVVTGTTGSVPGSANAGAIPPVSAVREMTTPDAKTAQTVRLRQISNGAPTAHRLLKISPPTPVWTSGLTVSLTRDIGRPMDSLQPVPAVARVVNIG